MPVLKTKLNNEEKELDFELKYQLSLTTEQRFRMMFKKGSSEFCVGKPS